MKSDGQKIIVNDSVVRQTEVTEGQVIIFERLNLVFAFFRPSPHVSQSLS